MGALLVRNFISADAAPTALVDCAESLLAMRQFTAQRSVDSTDEFWLLEHRPVYTMGQAADAAHILQRSDIPILQLDRGGQVTYHGPGQLMLYALINLSRTKLGVRDLIDTLEQSIIRLLGRYGLNAYAERKAPGVYINGEKIAALGLRVSRGCSYHGLCFNYRFDASPFAAINPCGYAGLKVTQLAEQLHPLPDKSDIATALAGELASALHYNRVSTDDAHWSTHFSNFEPQ